MTGHAGAALPQGTPGCMRGPRAPSAERGGAAAAWICRGGMRGSAGVGGWNTGFPFLGQILGLYLILPSGYYGTFSFLNSPPPVPALRHPRSPARNGTFLTVLLDVRPRPVPSPSPSPPLWEWRSHTAVTAPSTGIIGHLLPQLHCDNRPSPPASCTAFPNIPAIPPALPPPPCPM